VKTFEKVLGFVTEKMAWVAQWAMVGCVVLVVTDVTKRSAVGVPVPGVVEVVELIAAVILSMAIGYLTFVRGHVAVDVIVMRFRPQRQHIFDLVNSVISLFLAILLTYAIVKLGIVYQTSNWVTGSLWIPIYPFVYLVAAALALTCVVLIRDTVKAVIMLRTGGAA
jgi:TRAP-type mannitol/chloroaromatic compound transport system permease small subunit